MGSGLGWPSRRDELEKQLRHRECRPIREAMRQGLLSACSAVKESVSRWLSLSKAGSRQAQPKGHRLGDCDECSNPSTLERCRRPRSSQGGVRHVRECSDMRGKHDVRSFGERRRRRASKPNRRASKKRNCPDLMGRPNLRCRKIFSDDQQHTLTAKSAPNC